MTGLLWPDGDDDDVPGGVVPAPVPEVDTEAYRRGEARAATALAQRDKPRPSSLIELVEGVAAG